MHLLAIKPTVSSRLVAPARLCFGQAPVAAPRLFRFRHPDMPLTSLEAETRLLMKPYIEDFLANPHPDSGVGRRSVCPFIPGTLKHNLLFMTVQTDPRPDLARTAEAILALKQQFLSLPPTRGNNALLKTLIVAFPNVAHDQASGVIDVLQSRLKPFFVQNGLMIGEFHPLIELPGLHNPNFKPFKSPVPMLAIRALVNADINFLLRDTYTIPEKIHFLKAYLSQGFHPSRYVTLARTMLEKLLTPSKEAQPAQSGQQSEQQENPTRRCPFHR